MWNKKLLTDFVRIRRRFNYIFEPETGKIHEAGDIIGDCGWIKLGLRPVEIKEEDRKSQKLHTSISILNLTRD